MSGVQVISHAQADYALRLLEKGYSIGELARLIGCTPSELREALKEHFAELRSEALASNFDDTEEPRRREQREARRK